MWDFSLGASFAAMVRTAPFIVLRMAIYFGIALLYIIATGVGGALGYGFTSIGEGEGAGAMYGALFGFAGASGVLYFAREYILYLVKAGHIAVLVYHYDGKDLPAGKGQIDFATAEVKKRFAQASLLFAIDQIIKGVIKAITRTLSGIAFILPIPGLQNLMQMVNAVIRMSLTYVDEIILAHIIREGDGNPWEVSRKGLILYAQNAKTIVKNAVWLSLFMWLLTIVIFFVLLAPVLALMAVLPGNIGFVGFVVTFIVAWSFKAALLEPLAIYALMQVYFKAIEGQEPDPEWDERLSKLSKKFRKLKDKVTDKFSGSAPEPSPEK